MDVLYSKLDWTYIRSFLAVAETGSLSAAARKLRQSQPTMGRHIKAAENELGVTLFVRTTTGLDLTEAGRALVGPAQDMATASAQLETLAAGSDARLSGTVRITASVVVSHYILPSIISELRLSEPDIEIELVPSDTSENLLFREADIAIRMYQPTQLDIVTRKITEQQMALYAARNLLARLGQPKNIEELSGFPFVGFDRSDLIIRHIRQVGFDIDRHFFGVRCDDQAAYWRLVCAGCGLGAMQTVIGDDEQKVERLDIQPDLPSLPIWLATHEMLYKNIRVKRVWDHVADCLSMLR